MRRPERKNFLNIATGGNGTEETSEASRSLVKGPQSQGTGAPQEKSLVKE